MDNPIEQAEHLLGQEQQPTSPVKVDFSDTAKAFQHLNNKELKFSHFIFSTMQSERLVKSLSSLAITALKLHLPVAWAVKPTIFKQFCGGENFDEAGRTVQRLAKYNVKSILDYSVEAAQKDEDFDRTKNELLKILDFGKSNPNVPIASMKVTGIAPMHILEKLSAQKELTAAEKQAYAKAVSRLDEICMRAVNNDKGLYIDAEESWIQPAIDQLAEAMMAKYNKTKVYIFTTLQMYRHDRLEYLKELLTKSANGQFMLGVKFVRGAYLEKENDRAKAMNYPTPMQPNKAATDQDYNLAIEMSVNNLDRVAICAGSHNENSAQLLVNLMAQFQIPKNHPHVYFSQLFGMSDNISFTLAEMGYNVSKYLPYGPVKDTLPYLIRRADENKSVGGQMGKELTLLKQELNRRKISS